MYIQGILKKMESGKYGVVTKELSCGDVVEVYVNGDLVEGTIQADRHGEYYFLSRDKKEYKLQDLMPIAYERD